MKINELTVIGDCLKTMQEEMVEVALNSGGIMRVGENSEVLVVAPDPKTLRPEVKRGKIWSNFKKLGGNQKFSVSTGTAVASIRGTIFRVNKDSLSSVLVYDGQVDVGPDQALQDQLKAQKAAAGGEGRHEVAGPQEVPGPYEVTLDQWITIIKGMQINVRSDGRYDKFQFDQQADKEDPWVKQNQERDSVLGVSAPE